MNFLVHKKNQDLGLTPFESLHQEMNRLFGDFAQGFELEPFTANDKLTSFVPTMDVQDTGELLKFTAELPGLDEKDVEVSLENDVLTIKGEKKTESEEKGKGFFRRERSYGSFQRSFQLPVEVDAGKIDARFTKGVLEVNLPKLIRQEAQPKKIQIKSK